MTTQERINLLAEAALRSAPPTEAMPKPVTFMPSFEKLRSLEFATPPLPPAASPLQIAEDASGGLSGEGGS